MHEPNEPTLPNQLPSLREDIRIEQGGLDFNNHPSWVIHDLANNQFFHIGWQEYEMLSRWHIQDTEAFLDNLKQTSLANVSELDLRELLAFLSQNCLIEQPYRLIKQRKAHRDSQQNTHWLLRLVKHYLFFRIPLVKPDGMLDKAYPYFRWLFSQGFFTFIVLMTCLELLMLSREWNTYKATFFQLFDVEFFIFYALSLVTAKVFHELGHALAVKRYGLHVPSMGIAFLVLFPMLYTDTSQSWKITYARDRIIVALAGVWVEFCLALLSLWLWFFMPQGPFKSVCFFLSSYSLLTTLLINISPFLRFDGYHVLSDLLSMRNLQTRSFALATWWLRECLFGLNNNAPEYFPPHKRRLLIIYAFLCWLYRFLLFLGIALLVYHLFFKVLGIFLFAVEIYFFILNPIINEIRQWLNMKNELTFNRHTLTSLTVATALFLLFVVPWKSTVSLPATLTLYEKTYYSDLDGVVKKVHVHAGQIVSKGQTLLQLSSPKLDYELKKVNILISRHQWELRNIAVFQGQFYKQAILEKEIAALVSRRAFLLKKQQTLTVKAPFNGCITEVAPVVEEGTWVQQDQALLHLTAPAPLLAEGLANDDALRQLAVAQHGVFIPEELSVDTIPIAVQYIANGSITSLYQRNPEFNKYQYMGDKLPREAYHASLWGGQVAVRDSARQQLTPEENLYRIVFSTTADPKLTHALRGTAKIDVGYYSLASQLLKKVFALILREFSF